MEEEEEEEQKQGEEEKPEVTMFYMTIRHLYNSKGTGSIFVPLFLGREEEKEDDQNRKVLGLGVGK